LGFGAGLAFDPDGNLIVQDADTTTFQGRLQRIPIVESAGVLTFGPPEPLLTGMQSSAGVSVVKVDEIFTTGNGGLYRIAGAPFAESLFDSNGNPSQFATAIAFHPGSLPFEAFSGPGGGRLAYMADFGFAMQDSFVTLLTPAQPGDYNADGDVNAMDYAKWRGAFGTTDTSADGNRDGRVDAGDYVVWRKNITPAAESAATNVPEPSAFIPIVALIPLFAARRRGSYRLHETAEVSPTKPTRQMPERESTR
jgi:hypothetical protein